MQYWHQRIVIQVNINYTTIAESYFQFISNLKFHVEVIGVLATYLMVDGDRTGCILITQVGGARHLLRACIAVSGKMGWRG